MSDYQKITFTQEYIDQYWRGPGNIISRYYAYLQKGFGLVNEAKNYFLIVFGSYWTAKGLVILGVSINPNWILVLAVIGFPILIVIGRWYLYKASKSIEYITHQNGSITGFNPYNIQIETLETLKKILERLEKLDKA